METIDRVALSRAAQAATLSVFSTMLGVALEPGEPYVETKPPAPTEGVVSLIGMAGRWIGTGCINCSATLACRLTSQMLMAQYESVGEEVLDVIAELTNMIVGNIKTAVEDSLGPMGLSIPTVVYGRNFTTRSAGEGEWSVYPFFLDGERLEVKICLVPSREPRLAVRPGYSTPASLHA